MQNVRMADEYAYMAKLYLIDPNFEHDWRLDKLIEFRLMFSPAEIVVTCYLYFMKSHKP